MTTYKTYQEAKIANPIQDIFKCNSVYGVSDCIESVVSGVVHPIEECNPAYYCMSFYLRAISL